MTSAEIRQSFLDYFAARGHTIVPSASLLPNSPGLLFTNAGMNQFVPIFLGDRRPDVSHWAGARPGLDTRAADTQKCIRAGGKHNDLEDVGFDTYHHTLFEMLGNWSFGDYFKRESLEWGWELITKVWGIPPKRLFATVYSPDKAKGDPSEFDHEAHDIWSGIFKKEGLDPSIHIVHGNKKDNFWMMGDTGPCGPCSEIHFNLLPGESGDPLLEAAGRKLVNAGSPRSIEIWNHVFIQFNANADGSFSPLAARHVDTGMGFERVAGIHATTHGFKDFSEEPSNYAADIFAPLFARISELSGLPYSRTVPLGRVGLDRTQEVDIAFRVLVDHARTVSCAIADGILPANEGRNYVIRRILRRGILYGHKTLKLQGGFFESLVEPVVASLGTVFPELAQQQDVIRRVIRSEEESFGRTLGRGIELFEQWARDSAASGGAAPKVPGAFAFLLYDTYGFPLDMTQLLAQQLNIEVDDAAFDAEMNKQRERGRASHKKEVVVAATEGAGPAEAPTVFLGYTELHAHANLLEVVRSGPDSFLVFDQTPFYAEMGGQAGDSGGALIGGRLFSITGCVKDRSGRHLHKLGPASDGVVPAAPELGSAAELSVDVPRRRAVSRHHSATHLLHWALRKVLGTHVRQAGTHKTPDHLRFDFSHFEAVTPAQLHEIGQLVNGKILENSRVETYETEFDKKPEGTLAFFGEKYGKIVRVVDIGGFSRELCAGTHVSTSGEIGMVRILAESAIAAGVRRIEAVAGQAAFDHVEGDAALLASIAARLGASHSEISKKLENLVTQKADADRLLRGFQQKAAAGLATELAGKATERGGIRSVHAVVAVEAPENLRSLGAQVLAHLGDGVVVLGAAFGDKATVVAFCSPGAIQAGHQAGKLIAGLSAQLGGKGGGKPDFAMGGGRETAKLAEVLASL